MSAGPYATRYANNGASLYQPLLRGKWDNRFAARRAATLRSRGNSQRRFERRGAGDVAKKDKNNRKQARASLAHGVRLGIDLGGTKILAGVVDDEGRILGSAKRKTRAERDVDDVIARVVKTA